MERFVPYVHQMNFFFPSGFLPRVIKVAPACAIMISTYEFGKTFFHKHNEQRRGAWRVWSIAAQLHDPLHPNWPAFSSALACVLCSPQFSGHQGWGSRGSDQQRCVGVIYSLTPLAGRPAFQSGLAPKHAGKSTTLHLFACTGAEGTSLYSEYELTWAVKWLLGVCGLLHMCGLYPVKSRVYSAHTLPPIVHALQRQQGRIRI